MAKSSFSDEVARVVALYEEVIGGRALATHSMIERYGEERAMARLVVTADLQEGFKALRDSGHLDSTFEALVVTFAGRFSPEVVEAAQWRLDNPYSLPKPLR